MNVTLTLSAASFLSEHPRAQDCNFTTARVIASFSPYSVFQLRSSCKSRFGVPKSKSSGNGYSGGYLAENALEEGLLSWSKLI
mmetsp:Transcript_49042/g.84314  ORF Transcript_49042/g.84314 Transcript_49042/m.84314 type:complete len:83 (+) Transcript_49042:134-382(+)